MKTLSPAEINTCLQQLPNWSYDVAGSALRSTRTFPDFAAAMRFVNRIAELAEAANHHPDLDIRYNKVLIALSSHDAAGVTTRDIELAQKISAL
ncbi:MAG: 4a-hydroxytetrahydrobiopterin dehydratase [Acidobacteriaceae bacterium]